MSFELKLCGEAVAIDKTKDYIVKVKFDAEIVQNNVKEVNEYMDLLAFLFKNEGIKAVLVPVPVPGCDLEIEVKKDDN